MKDINSFDDVITVGADLLENVISGAQHLEKKIDEYTMNKKIKKVKEGLNKADKLLSEMKDMEED